MANSVIEGLLSFSRFIIFKVISPKVNTAYFKNFMDFAYSFYEKIAISFEILSNNYLELYDEIVEKEIKMAQITKNSNVLLIGCGSLPATTALIGEKTQANIVSIDYDMKAFQNAKDYFKNSKIKSNIKIVYADGHNYPVKDFDVIFVLYGMKKQKDFLVQLSKKIENNTRIVLRTSQDTLNEFIGGTEFLSKWFVIKDCIHSERIYTTDSYLLMKKK